MGNTVWYDGKLIKPGTRLKNYEEARKLTMFHIETYIYPQMMALIAYQRLNTQQKAAMISLFYNVGCKNLTGYNEKFEKKGECSTLVKMINSGAPLEECAEYIPSFCMSGGKVASGLKKRRPVEKWYFNGLICYDDVMNAKVNSIYLTNENDYCARYKNSQGCYKTKDDLQTINKVLKVLHSDKNKRMTVGELLGKMGFVTEKRITPTKLEPLDVPKLTIPNSHSKINGLLAPIIKNVSFNIR